MIRNSVSLSYEVEDHGTTNSLISLDSRQALDQGPSNLNTEQEEGREGEGSSTSRVCQVNEPFYFNGNHHHHHHHFEYV